jgi:hypothetical protein
MIEKFPGNVKESTSCVQESLVAAEKLLKS